jgi:UDP-galactopyranose mutase
MTRYRQESGYTVLSVETPGAAAKHYPVYDADGVNRERAKNLQSELERLVPTAVVAGRLARYVYIDMDQAIIQGLNAARKIIRRLNGEEEE